jgi:hypothetical protein
MGFWSKIWRDQAKVWTYGRLENGPPAEVVIANSGYLTVTLLTMYVVNVRQGLSKFYGTVHSYAALLIYPKALLSSKL